MNLFSFTTRSIQARYKYVKANSQKAGPFLICSLCALIWTAAAAELRTWTFSQDGQMKSSSGGVTSFKKKGRIDAAFVRVETNDVVLMAPHREIITVALTNLSDLDRDFVARAVRLDEPDPVSTLPAIERNELSRRKVEAAKVRDDAAAKRRLAQTELDDAEKLDSEATRLSDKAGDFQSQALAASNCASDLAASGKAKSAAGIASSAAELLQQDIAKIRLQAQEKRQRAAGLQKEAAQLEQTAGLLETNQASATSAPANGGTKSATPNQGTRKENPHS
jgi:hypothetical protein